MQEIRYLHNLSMQFVRKYLFLFDDISLSTSGVIYDMLVLDLVFHISHDWRIRSDKDLKSWLTASS